MKRNNFVKVILTLLSLFSGMIAVGQTNVDIVFIYDGGTQVVDVLANDVGCNPSTLSIVNDPNNYAKVVNNKIEITIGVGASSFYYVEYQVWCGGGWSKNYVHIHILIPTSRTYSACPAAELSLGFQHVNGRKHYWYDSGKNPLDGGKATDAITVKAPNTLNSVATYYVRAEYGSRYSDYIPITLSTDADCGTPSPGCATTGSLLFREDFGGNGASEPVVSSTPLPVGVTEYDHDADNKVGYSAPNKYWLLKYNNNIKGGTGQNGTNVWHSGFSDHTRQGNTGQGYMFMVNAAMDRRKFFEYNIGGLCDGMELYFSVQVHNLMFNDPYVNANFPDDPNLRFELLDIHGKALGIFITGDIGRQARNNPAWKHYGFKFVMPSGHASLKLKIINNSLKSSGNDFALDDIEIRFCAPPVKLPPSSSVDVTLCPGGALELKGSYTNTNDFFDPHTLKYQWERHADKFASSGWTTVSGPFPVVGGTLTEAASRLTINPVTPGDAGYYRLTVADDSRITNAGKQNCRAMSDPVRVSIPNVPVPAISPPTSTVLCAIHITLTASAAGQIYTWYRNGQQIPGVTSRSYNATQPGSYQVSYYNASCSSSTSAPVALQSCVAARNDTVFTYTDTKQVVDVLANDDHSSCQGGKSISLTATPANGAANVVGGNRVEYTPGKNFTGIDRFTYKLSCGTSNEVATVYVVVLKPLSRVYTACPGATVPLGFNAVKDVSYDWYHPDQQTLVGSGNTINATAPLSGDKTYYIKARYNNVPSSSFMSVRLNADAHCGTPPSGCAASGTLLFREDFGGNEPGAPTISPVPLPVNTTGYNHSTNNSPNYSAAENYWLLKYNANPRGGMSGGGGPVWHDKFSDHTCRGDLTRGYMFMVDASTAPTKFFEYKIGGLCEKTELYFSVKVHNLMVSGMTGSVPDDPDLRFELFDSINNTLGVFITGTIGREAAGSPAWKHYGFNFVMPEGHKSLTLKIVNNSLKSNGNDFALDDIEIRFCAPPVTLSFHNDTTVCLGSVIELKGSYTDNGTFDDATLQYQWVVSEYEPFDQKLAWTIVSPNPNPKIPGNHVSESDSRLYQTINEHDAGYYRLIVMDDARKWQYGCRAMSNPVKVSGRNCARAIPDTVATSGAVTFDPLANDSLGGCRGTNPVARIGVAAGGDPTHGTLTVNPDATLSYTPVAGFGGVDSADYYMICGSDSSAARIFFMVVNFAAAVYVACPGGSVTMNIRNPTSPTSGVRYDWRDAQRNGSIVPNGSNKQSLTVVKDAQPIQTWWVETRWRGMTFPRIPAPLRAGDNCGTTTPAGCAVDGTVIWKESFDGYGDGLNPSSSIYSRTGLPVGTTTYKFATGGGGATGLNVAGHYSIVKRGDNTLFWVEPRFGGDHTSLDPSVGRYFLANGKASRDKVYEQTILNVCSGTKLYFSFWMKGLTAQLTWTVYSVPDDRVLATLALPKLPSDADHIAAKAYPLAWEHYGFNFEVPAGVTSVKFDIYNNETGISDNDFAVDDIEVRLCAPAVTVTPASDTEVCAGANVTLSGSFTNNNTFANDNLAAKWLYSANGATGWGDVSGSLVTGGVGVIANSHTLLSMGSGNEGYYRMVVSDGNNIDNENCRASSKQIRIAVKPIPTILDKSTTICSGALDFKPTATATGELMPAGTQYTWTVTSNVGGVTGAAPETSPQSSISGTLINTGNGQQIVNYTVTPEANGCSGPVFNLGVTVTDNPTAGGLNYNGGNPVCRTTGGDVAPTWSVGPSGGGAVSFSAIPSTGLSVNASDGRITPASSTAGSYTVKYEMGAFGGCPEVATTTKVTIADAPTISALAFPLSPLCEGVQLQASDLTAPTTNDNNSAVTSVGWEIDDKNYSYAPLALPFPVTFDADDGKHIRYFATNGCGTTQGGDKVTLTVLPDMIYPDIRIRMCPAPTRVIGLSSYLDTLNFKSVLWERVSTGAPDFLHNTASGTGVLPTDRFQKGTFVYKYKIENECGEKTARAYVLNAENHVLRSESDTIAVCVRQWLTANMQLNQIMGIEAEGTWQYDQQLNQHVSIATTPSRFDGARVFNAVSAWNALHLNPAFSFPYNNDPDAAAFKFRYETSPQSCNGRLVKEIVIIVLQN